MTRLPSFFSSPGLAGLLLTGWILGCDHAATSSGSPQAVSAASSKSAIDTVAVQLNWHPEAEHGGIYQAQADGTYEQAKLKVDIRAGGNGTPVAAELQLGRVEFAMTNADDVVLARSQGIDMVAVMAVAQDSPRCILVRQDSGVKDFSDLAGMTLQRNPARMFVKFMRAKGLLKQVKEVPYPASVASLIADPQVAVQAYSFAEPLLAEEQGVAVRTLMVSQLGWNPYSSVLVTSGRMIRENPEKVQRFVDATRVGWQHYLTDGTLGNEAILAANQHGMTEAALKFGIEGIVPLALPGGMPMAELGKMEHQRWETLVDQMTRLDDETTSSVQPEDCYTLAFLNQNEDAAE